MGEDQLFLGGIAGQVGPNVVDLAGVTPIEGIDTACKAIDVIVEQGEGSPGDCEDSHYRRFLAVRGEFEALAKSNPTFAPAWPVANNPVFRRPPEPEGKVYVDRPQAAALLDFACATYGLALRLLVQSFGRRGPGVLDGQKVLMSAAIDLMHVLGTAGDALARLPASSSVPGVNAGMSFTMLRGVEPLLAGEVEQCLIRERIQALAAGAHSLPVPKTSVATLDQLAEVFSTTLAAESNSNQNPGSSSTFI